MQVSVLWRFGGYPFFTLDSNCHCRYTYTLPCRADLPCCTCRCLRHLLLHPHLMSSLHAFDASGRPGSPGRYPTIRTWMPSPWPAWNAALLTSCSEAAWVGGIPSMLLVPWENMDCRTWLTSWWGLVQLFIIHYNHKSFQHSQLLLESIVSVDDRIRKTSVASG